ncbi:hypothetical protein TcasGA2_TC033038 [Tribolium castaneum]|uniref:DNA repair protein SWI5 homolog n=1 Tax=Tribolium castaneum TaxID=7070 RepID=A0A139WHT3_TRICA|nr:hypothetical protein TcasGA2_TC033038 [Tribolium castaneum]
MAQPPDPQTNRQALLDKLAALDQQLEDFKSRGVTSDFKAEIKALHDYNEMKDLTQRVLGHLANFEQESTLAELHERYDLPLE